MQWSSFLDASRAHLSNGFRSQPRWLWALLIVCALRGALWATLVPVFQTPDEPTHFGHAYDFYMNGGAPWSPERYYSERMAKIRQISESSNMQFQPEGRRDFAADTDWGKNEEELRSMPDAWVKHTSQYPYLSTVAGPQFYYWVCGWLLRVFPSEDAVLQIYWLRLFSVFLGLLSILLCYLACAEVFGRDSQWSAYATTFFAFWPLFAFMSAAVAGDAWCYPFIAFFFYGLLRWLNRRDAASTWWLGASLVLIIGTRLHMYAAYAIAGMALFFVMVAERRIRWRELGVGALASAVLFAFYFSYPGFRGLMTANALDTGAYKQALQVIPWSEVPVADFAKSLFWNNISGLWGTFAWNDTYMPEKLYQALRALTYGSVVATLIVLPRRHIPPAWRLPLLTLALTVLVFFVGMLAGNLISYRNSTYVYGLGRQLFLVYLPVSVCVTAGASAWLGSFAPLAAQLACGCMVGLNLASLFLIVVPRFYL